MQYIGTIVEIHNWTKRRAQETIEYLVLNMMSKSYLSTQGLGNSVEEELERPNENRRHPGTCLPDATKLTQIETQRLWQQAKGLYRFMPVRLDGAETGNWAKAPILSQKFSLPDNCLQSKTNFLQWSLLSI